MRCIDRENLPWVYDSEASCIDGRLRYVCDTGGLAGGGKVLLNEQDAQAAVQAVNYYGRLVEALEECRGVMEAFNRAPGASRDEWEFECEVKEIDNLLAELNQPKYTVPNMANFKQKWDDEPADIAGLEDK